MINRYLSNMFVLQKRSTREMCSKFAFYLTEFVIHITKMWAPSPLMYSHISAFLPEDLYFSAFYNITVLGRSFLKAMTEIKALPNISLQPVLTMC